MLKILSVIGTRPEAIKLAPVLHELKAHKGQVRSVVCVTAQHREMLDPILDLFAIKADYDLNVMKPDQKLPELTAGLIQGLSKVVWEEKPDWILAQGDTTTVLASALAAFYQRVAFGHVEAGLRTGDLNNPFPEEMNRRVADSMAKLLFAPTEQNRQTLLSEGIADERIVVTGNTVVDALMQIRSRPIDLSSSPLGDLPTDRPLVLVTAHRRESFGPQLREICFAIRELALRYENSVQFVYPVHLNPNVRRPVSEILSGISNLRLIDPVDYQTMVHLMGRAILILTDSGGIQEEAPSLGVPVLVMRQATERPEGVEAGVVRLVGTEQKSIIAAASYLIGNPDARREMASAENPYGDGRAAGRIVSALLRQGVKSEEQRAKSEEPEDVALSSVAAALSAF